MVKIKAKSIKKEKMPTELIELSYKNKMITTKYKTNWVTPISK
jgi:hypothetical protein